ncbi:MAG: hypothetical protein Q9201_000978 [Fulgogasparrea decipioides]
MTSPELSRSNSTSPQYPALNNELATLSNKLIRAINHQTDLDDTLSETRHELSAARQRVKQLEATVSEHNALVANGDLVHKSEVERLQVKLMDNLAHEQKQRGVMEKDKRGIEQELESLTTALFEEANQMVAAARREREAADRRSDQLRAQLNDTELLLVSHQEQLAELKAAMHQMAVGREDTAINAGSSTTPSTPAMHMPETLNRFCEAQNLSPVSGLSEDVVPPAPPTSFTYLLHPVLRTDLQAYDDFHTLLSTSRKSSPSSRVSSGSLGTLNVTGLAYLASGEQQTTTGRMPSNRSTPSLSTSTAFTPSSTAPSSANTSVSSRDLPVSGIPLKETRFYKRSLTECIEPTLRLDTAPGLSWLARRTVINSMAEGGLVVEPMPVAIKYNVFPCSLCGENRQDAEYTRSHRFRTSESDNAQRYPLCGFCLTRLRASCDFLGFLRMLKDGHWRADDEEAELQAWEECVRLQERMFWARIGGGVVPTLQKARDSTRTSVEQDASAVSSGDQSQTAIDHNEQPCAEGSDSKPIEAKEEKSSAMTTISYSHPTSEGMNHTLSSQPTIQAHNDESEIAAPEQLQNDLQRTLADTPQGLGIEDTPVQVQEHVGRDSVIMPGAFE